MDENKNVQATVEETRQETSGQEATDNSQDTMTMESMIAELAKVKAENMKNKAALDKALHNNGELTKQLRAKMSASEQEEEAKREAEEAQKNRIKELENFKLKAEARERYMTFGMPADLAKEAADAEVSGDMDLLTSVYRKHQDATLKAHEAEWLKKRPIPETGRDEDAAKEDPFLAGFNSYTY